VRPLAGIRVVEASRYVLGPFAALQMADLGAEVIKVESPRGGDPLRSFSQRRNGVSLVFANCNRNQQSVFLDLKTDARTYDFEEQLSSADVLVTNWRPAVAERLGFSEDWARTKFLG
jgi:crotonobetainyl-CoA:carnitine CoA-transferase CaiB-like acyl-CoA transferase